jgi:hypothetical protein
MQTEGMFFLRFQSSVEVKDVIKKPFKVVAVQQ